MKLNRALTVATAVGADANLWAGDDPPRDRTAELRALDFPTRHLGPVQMTTDTAVGVTKRVVVDRGPSFFAFCPPSALRGPD